MNSRAALKDQVREFYDSIGWSQLSEGLYQNARYEDLRPVSREYLDRCHRRVGRHLPPTGRYLLDAGSGPIQYPQYLEYSQGYQRRVCLDISHLALQEARRRVGEHGYFVLGDVAHLPFAPGRFDAVVSLHTIHHLPPEEHELALRGLQTVLSPGGRGVVVYSWGDRSALMRLAQPFTQGAFAVIRLYRRVRGAVHRSATFEVEPLSPSPPVGSPPRHAQPEASDSPNGTYTYRHSFGWAQSRLRDLPAFEIRVWRSVSTAFLRAFIHRRLLGITWLRIVFWLEEHAPHLLGRIGQYPMLLFAASETPSASEGSAG